MARCPNGSRQVCRNAAGDTKARRGRCPAGYRKGCASKNGARIAGFGQRWRNFVMETAPAHLSLKEKLQWASPRWKRMTEEEKNAYL